MADNTKYLKNLTKASDYIEKNISRKINMRDLAGYSGMSEGNFWRIFKKFMGESVGSYIRKRRLTIAGRMLVSKKIGIEKVCDKLGFDSTEVFYRSFKKQFGITPGRYRGIDGHHYMNERSKMSKEYIRHMLSGGISLKPTTFSAKKTVLFGMRQGIKRRESIIKPAMFFTAHFMKMIISGCENSGSNYVVVSGIDNRKLFRPDDRLEVFIGSRKKCLEGESSKKVLPQGRYAVFTHKGPLQNAGYSCEYIFSRWAPSRKMRAPERIIAVLYDGNYLSNGFSMELMLQF